MRNWEEHEIEKLKLFYKHFNKPSDQIVKDKTLLDNFTSRFNARITTDEPFSSKEVADQLFKLRKSGNLPRIRN